MTTESSKEINLNSLGDDGSEPTTSSRPSDDGSEPKKVKTDRKFNPN